VLSAATEHWSHCTHSHFSLA